MKLKWKNKLRLPPAEGKILHVYADPARSTHGDDKDETMMLVASAKTTHRQHVGIAPDKADNIRGQDRIAGSPSLQIRIWIRYGSTQALDLLQRIQSGTALAPRCDAHLC